MIEASLPGSFDTFPLPPELSKAAFEFVSSGASSKNEAYLDRQSGKIYWYSEFSANDEELPDDIDDKK